MRQQTAIQIPDEIYKRLQQLVTKTGRTASDTIREAIEEYLDERDDLCFAEQALKDLHCAKDRMIDSKEFWRGVEH